MEVAFLAWELLEVVVVQRVVHSFQKVDGLGVAVDQHHVPRALAVLLLVHQNGQRRALVGAATHLVDVPIGVEQAQVAHPDVGPNALHLLGVPQGEGVVVSVGEQHGVGRQGIQVILGHVHAGPAAGSAVVVPAFRRHEEGHQGGEQRQRPGPNGAVQ